MKKDFERAVQGVWRDVAAGVERSDVDRASLRDMSLRSARGFGALLFQSRLGAGASVQQKQEFHQ